MADRPLRVAVLVDRLSNELEVLYPIWRLREEGMEVRVLTRDGRPPGPGENGMLMEKYIQADGTIADARADDYDAVVCPGGFSPDFLRTLPEVKEFVARMDAQGKVVAAICHGAWIPISAGIVRGRRLTSVPRIRDDVENAGAEWVDEEVVRDRNLITSRRPPDLGAFCRAIIAALQERAR